MNNIKIDLKFFGYQILGVFIIWIGMTFFVDDMFESGKYIYYGVTSWLLFLIVLFVRKFISDRKEKGESKED